MQYEVYTFWSGIFQILGVLAAFLVPFITLRAILLIFRWVIGRARGERYESLREETLDTYDRARSTYYAGGRRETRDRYYAEMRGGRGHRGKQTRY